MWMRKLRNRKSVILIAMSVFFGAVVGAYSVGFVCVQKKRIEQANAALSNLVGYLDLIDLLNQTNDTDSVKLRKLIELQVWGRVVILASLKPSFDDLGKIPQESLCSLVAKYKNGDFKYLNSKDSGEGYVEEYLDNESRIVEHNPERCSRQRNIMDLLNTLPE